MKRLIFSVFLFIFLLAPLVSAFSMTDRYNYKIEAVVAQGVGNASSFSYKSVELLEPFSGSVNSSSFLLCLGFLCQGFLEPNKEIVLSGQLRYTNGTLITNSDIQLNLTSTFFPYYKFVVNKTDGGGFFRFNFFIPAYIPNENFIIDIRSLTEIETQYKCTYNVTDQYCYK